MTTQALPYLTIGQVLLILNKGGATKFASLTYKAEKTGEIARYNVLLGADLASLYAMDIQEVTAMLPTLEGIPLLAAHEIIKSRKESLEKGIGNNDAYTCKGVYDALPIPGVKVHKENGIVYVDGLLQHKTTIVPGVHKSVNSSAKTIAKAKISKTLPSSKYRQFILTSLTKVAINGEVLELNTV